MKRKVQRILSMVLIGVLILTTSSGVYATSSPEINQDDYIAIYTKEDLDNIRNNLTGKYLLMNDIIFSEEDFSETGDFYNDGQGWLPIGPKITEAFAGVIDGNGYTVKGLYSNLGNKDHNTFGFIGFNHGDIKNLNFDNYSLNLKLREREVKADMRVGLVAGYMPAGHVIENCSVTGQINIDHNCNQTVHVGGIVGTLYGAVRECLNQADIDVSFNATEDWCWMEAGGIVGDSGYGVVEQCANTGSIKLEKSGDGKQVFTRAGGIIGYMWGKDGTVKECYNLGSLDVLAYQSFMGGIAGQMDSPMMDCYNVSDDMSIISEYRDNYLGGIVGVSSAPITRCYNLGVIESEENIEAGALVGTVGITEDIRIDSCYYDNRTKIGVGRENAEQGTALSLEEMQILEHFNGFDFDNVWIVDASDNSEYLFPQLKNAPKTECNNNIYFKNSSVNVVVGQTYTQNPVMEGQCPLKSVLWSSSDDTVASVDSKGKVTAVKVGSAQITAEYPYGNKLVSYTIVVTKPDLKAPAKVSAKLYGYNDIKVNWSKVPDADGYYVYYKKAAWEKYKLYKTTTALNCSFLNLDGGSKYFFRVYPYAKVGGEIFKDNSYKTSGYIYTLKKTTVKSVKKNSSKNVKITWNNINGETGYQISKSAKKTGTNIVATVKTTTGKSKVIKAMKGKIYYYKVRAYKTVTTNGVTKKIYGPWSKTVKFKLK